MKNKNTENSGNKMNKTNIFIGLLIGLTILIFGWKIYLQQHPTTSPKILDSTKVDQMLEKVKKGEEKTTNFAGSWSSEGENPAKFTLNEDKTVSDLDGVKTWSAAESTLTLVKDDDSTIVIELGEDGSLTIAEVVYKK